eukprot:gene10532-11468_t
MNVHEYRMLIEEVSFFDGESHHPIHRALKIPIHILRIAHLIASDEQKELVNNGQKQDVIFTEYQVKLFHILQLMAGNFLSKYNLHGLAVTQRVELSPNLLLPIIEEGEADPAASRILPLTDKKNINESATTNPTTSSKKKKKKSTKKVKSLPVEEEKTDDTALNPITINIVETTTTNIDIDTNVNNIHFNFNSTEITSIAKSTPEAVEDTTSTEAIIETKEPEITETKDQSQLIEMFLNDTERRGFSLSRNKLRQIIEESVTTSNDGGDIKNSLQLIKHVCREYEDTILEIREKYDSIIQAINLKLFIKENQIELMQEKSQSP